MPEFYYIINNYINNISNLNEKKIIEEAINLMESKPVILDEELKVAIDQVTSEYNQRIVAKQNQAKSFFFRREYFGNRRIEF